MILEIADIQRILENDPNKAEIKAAQEMRDNLFAHAYGEGLARLLGKIASFENDTQFAIRKKYARSNSDLIDRLTRPIDKVFSAAGGSTYYDLPKSHDQDLRGRLKNIENGLSLRKWMGVFWRPVYLTDPMGLIFIEIDAFGNAYPTYKGSNAILAYKLNGRTLDYVIFKDKTEERIDATSGIRIESQYYRVVDDAFDFVVKWENGTAQVVADESYPNHFGRVPAILASDIPVIGSTLYCSFLQPTIKIADEFLRENSVKSVYKMLHGFPKAWEYQSACPVCKGVGYDKGEKCPACSGTGVKIQRDVSETRLLPVPTSSDQPILAPHIAGYTTPPIEAWDKMSDELKHLEAMMFETLWGTRQVDDQSNNTATGRFIDTQPVNDRLAQIAEAAETVEAFIVDLIAGLYYGATYKGASINYGRRFQIESPDTLWQKYQSARSAGAPDAMLDDMLRDYVQAKYDNNSLELQRQMKLIDLEPFPHLTASQVKALDVAPEDYWAKLYFGEFIGILGANDVLALGLPALKAKLQEFILNKKTNDNNGSNGPDQGAPESGQN